MKSTLTILPAAGKGTRVNADLSSGKELLEDPKVGKPLIEVAARSSWLADQSILVISRESKKGLNAYIKKGMYNASLLEVKDEALKEWPDTILLSNSLWTSRNIMRLPDTRFNDEELVLRAMEMALMSADVVFATFEVDDISKFAVVSEQGWFCEKPNNIPTLAKYRGIGLIGFRQEAGKYVFSQLSQRGNWRCLPASFKRAPDIMLDRFVDITRDGSISIY